MSTKVIPPEAIPDQGGYTVSIEGKDYLVMNDAMFTFYRRSMGEFSDFFLALRDEKKILGCRCTSCGIVRVPPFALRCPECNFAPTEMIEVEDTGTMIATPPITYFANSLFQKQVPFGRGRILLKGADTALSINCYTTRGILVPGLIQRGTEMKVVFQDERIGEITDIFCVPAAELTAEQIAKKGLLSSELDWERAVEPQLPERTAESRAGFEKNLHLLESLVAEMNECARARADIAGWSRVILVKSAGGNFIMEIAGEQLKIKPEFAAEPDFIIVCPDLEVLLDGLGYRGSLTQAIMKRDLWISKNSEFTTIFKLERMARSLARSKKE
ncbi:MAG TPA: hypothetical protein PKV91_06970 [Bacillota bacterium]|jgi:uncharacterized OB-fold protein|nr:hypothetical protein [Bacillota bacterium]HPZ12081.1 hypothetical protein [Bacillota bacterium]HQE10282.1 hypothetical protein [Bacillota bacterium]